MLFTNPDDGLMSESELADKVAAVKEVTALFRVERIVYVCIIAVCLLIFLLSVIFALMRGQIGYLELTPMFSSGGAVAFMTGRLIHMWNRTMSLLGAPAEG